MSKIEKISIATLFIIALLSFQYGSKLNYYVSHSDSANMVDNINSTYLYGVPRSQINKSANDVVTTALSKSAKDVCSQPLVSSNTEFTKTFERHAYVFLYALSPFRSISSGVTIAAFFHALAFIGLLASIYYFLRKNSLPIYAALAFGFMVSAHPAWSASVFGQFYPDRFFLLAGFLYIVFVHQRITKDTNNTILILFLAVFASLIHERAAMMVGGFTLASLLLYRNWTGWTRKDIPLLLVAICTLCYAIGYMVLFNKNSDYGSFTSSLTSLPYTLANNEAFRLNLEKFLIVNLGFLVLAAFEWRLALIALVAMLPNVIGTIGGAEKTGWSTHYHSTYFPFLLAAASIGSIKLWQILRIYSIKWMIVVPFIFIGISLLALNPYSTSPLINFSSSNTANNAWVKMVGVLTNTGDGAGIRSVANFRRSIAAEVPSNAVVTTYEGMFPALLGEGRVIHNYPLGLDNANYAVLSYTMDKQSVMQLSGAVSYLGEENRRALDHCLNARIHEAGYKVMKLFPTVSNKSAGEVLLKRGID